MKSKHNVLIFSKKGKNRTQRIIEKYVCDQIINKNDCGTRLAALVSVKNNKNLDKIELRHIDAIFIPRQFTVKAIEYNKTAFICFIDMTFSSY